ncbi:MerR family transcriptional regulator [Sneathiella glossodoripedis]|uniref:MerR family transcriptional regulator n=1 Tax=Sneathiella glossodoripedis TaxID=418853 RepID=UPI000470EA82|nr:helix-turn-helix domain-containing protein [Sneathiella glossodoripedis]
MYSIGELSKRTGVKIPTIRYYEDMGLLEQPIRSQGNQRRYSEDGLKQLSFIRHSRELGFSIEDIKELLELSQHPEYPCADAHAIATRHLEEVRERERKLRKLKKELLRITKCNADSISECAVIETLADHEQCVTEH